MLSGPPDPSSRQIDASLAAFGLPPDFLGDQSPVSEGAPTLWACNVAALNLYRRLHTQWRVGPGGATGLDYAAIPVVLRLIGVPRQEWSDLFEALQVCESEALAVFSEQSEQS